MRRVQQMMERNRNQPELPQMLSSLKVKCPRRATLITWLWSIFLCYFDWADVFIIICLHWSSDKGQGKWRCGTRQLVSIYVFLHLHLFNTNIVLNLLQVTVILKHGQKHCVSTDCDPEVLAKVDNSTLPQSDNGDQSYNAVTPAESEVMTSELSSKWSCERWPFHWSESHLVTLKPVHKNIR